MSLDPLMPVENDLSAEGRMAAHADCDVSPCRIDEMEKIMIDERKWLFLEQEDASIVRYFHVPH